MWYGEGIDYLKRFTNIQIILAVTIIHSTSFCTFSWNFYSGNFNNFSNSGNYCQSFEIYSITWFRLKCHIWQNHQNHNCRIYFDGVCSYCSDEYFSNRSLFCFGVWIFDLFHFGYYSKFLFIL